MNRKTTLDKIEEVRQLLREVEELQLASRDISLDDPEGFEENIKAREALRLRATAITEELERDLLVG